jgi:rRNA-processing protein FCF1
MTKEKVIVDDLEYFLDDAGNACDEEGNIVHEAHDLLQAEVQSVDSVSTAAKSTKRAPQLKGSKVNSEPMKTLGAKVGAMYDKLKGLSKEDLDIAYNAIMGDALYEQGEVQVKEDIQVDANFTDELNQLVESEVTLSEEFKSQAAVLFEMAIKSKVSAEIDRLETEYENGLNEAIESMSSDIVEKVDSYLNYVVETWMEENEVAIEQGLRTEIAENFMENLRAVFEESYIEIPESKVDLVDELAQQVEELEEQLDKTLSDAIEMSEQLEIYKRLEIVREASGDLAETQADKLFSLTQDLDFENEETFAEKVKSVKESVFKKVSVVGSDITEESGEADEPADVSPIMEKYVSALNKTAAKS